MSVQPPSYSGQFEADRVADEPVPLSPPQAQIKEQHRLPDTDPAVSDPTASSFAKIVRWHPAINYFGYLADRVMPMSWSPNERFARLARNHPRWFKWAVLFDAAVTATAVLSPLARLGYAASTTLLQ